MSQMTKEINKVTGTIIGVSGKLILYAVIILLLFEGMSKGYQFGHEIFYPTAMSEAPGPPRVVTIKKGETAAEAAHALAQLGLLGNELAFRVQMRFYEYEIYPGTYTLNTSMTAKEILQVLNEKPAEEETLPAAEAAAKTQDVMLDMYGAKEGESEVDVPIDSVDDYEADEDGMEIEIELEDEIGEENQ